MSINNNFREDDLEKASIEILEEMGYEYLYGLYISVDGEYPEREDYRGVLLKQRVLVPYIEIIKVFQKRLLMMLTDRL